MIHDHDHPITGNRMTGITGLGRQGKVGEAKGSGHPPCQEDPLSLLGAVPLLNQQQHATEQQNKDEKQEQTAARPVGKTQCCPFFP